MNDSAGLPPSVKRLLIVANAPSSNTRTLAEAVLAGARSEEVDGVSVRWLEPLAARPDDVLAADALILGTTENFGLLSGLMKDFLERVYTPCLERTQGRPWALYVRAGNDGVGAVSSLTRIVTGLRWREVQPPLVMAGTWDESHVERARALGLTMAASLEAGVI